MNRQQKLETITELKQHFAESPATFVVGVQGMTVEQMQALRTGLRAKGSRLKVAKVRLMKRALDGIEGIEGLTSHMREQLGVVFANEEPTLVARTLRDFAKENEALTLVAGYFENEVLDEAAVAHIASLPSRFELLAMVARVLNEPMAKFARAIQAVADKRAEEGGAASQEEAPEASAEDSESAAESAPKSSADKGAAEQAPSTEGEVSPAADEDVQS